ncbi:MAG: L-lysine 2,3-aminomutase [Planctomycetota bacterium]|nr:MAG: L-lysine 2,3-aminomutase [Planctomycetota bacterium]
MSALDDPRWADWRWQHVSAATSLNDVEHLFPGRFELSKADRAQTAEAAERYAMRATPYYLSLAEQASRSDPVWALAVPDPAELAENPADLADPIGDEAPGLRPHPALTRRYRDRVLLFPTSLCSVHCRHCFRKRLVGRPEEMPQSGELDGALDWIASQPEIHEVILTGGDPLTLGDERLLDLLQRLDAIEHVWSLRLHTRLPVVNPFRITEELATGLGRLRTPVVLVAHFNHAQEVAPEAEQAAQRLRAQGVTLLNQAVLLAGINDTAHAQRELSWALIRAGYRPYALHHADLVPGTAHLRTSLDAHLDLQRELRGTLPGWALPRSLLDLPGGHGKLPLEPPRLERGAQGEWWLTDLSGQRHRYSG